MTISKFTHDLSSDYCTHISNCLLVISMWMYNRHLRINTLQNNSLLGSFCHYHVCSFQNFFPSRQRVLPSTHLLRSPSNLWVKLDSSISITMNDLSVDKCYQQYLQDVAFNYVPLPLQPSLWLKSLSSLWIIVVYLLSDLLAPTLLSFQSVLNTVARGIILKQKSDHVTPLWKTLQCFYSSKNKIQTLNIA